jgi:hypothetical protein
MDKIFEYLLKLDDAELTLLVEPVFESCDITLVDGQVLRSSSCLYIQNGRFSNLEITSSYAIVTNHKIPKITFVEQVVRNVVRNRKIVNL